MSHVFVSTSVPFDLELGSLLLANMLSAWLDSEVAGRGTAEAAHESQNHRASPQQVRLCLPAPVNAGSSTPPFALREKARELAWSETLIRTLDRDLGKSGTQMTEREDFKSLVADVSMGQVGAVLPWKPPPLALGSGLASAAAVVCPHADSGH